MRKSVSLLKLERNNLKNNEHVEKMEKQVAVVETLMIFIQFSLIGCCL